MVVPSPPGASPLQLGERHPEFDSAFAKYAWAIHHAGTLEAELDAFGRGLDGKEFFRFDADWDEVRQGFPIVITEVTTSYPMRLSGVLSDVVHNMRCVLDHVAWAMVGRGATPPPTLRWQQQISVQFPVTLNPSTFNKRARTCLPGVRERDLEIVRSHQPWAIGVNAPGLSDRPAEEDGYWLLSLLDNRDKHRTIELIPHVPVGGTISRSQPRDCVLGEPRPILGASVPMEAGQELAFIPARPTGPQPQVSFQPKIRCEATVNGRFLLAGWMRELIGRTSGLLGELSHPPTLIDELADWASTPFFDPDEFRH